MNKKLGLRLHDPNYDTIAGLVLGHFNRIPEIGDMIEIDGLRIRVEEMDGRRIARLAVEWIE